MISKDSRILITPHAEFWLALGLVMFTTISIRLTELPLWNDAAFFVQNERLMATHDAYAWLAGAKNIGGYAGHAFSRLLAFLSHVSGMGLAEIGFWSPIILTPLLAVPTCLLAWALKRPEGGLIFGMLTTSGLGFLVRTRLGFCDTDLVALLFPLAGSCALAAWLAHKRESICNQPSLTTTDVFFLFGIGALGWLSVYTYPGNISLMFSTCALSSVLTFFIIPSNQRENVLTGVFLIFAMTFAGLAGIFFATIWLFWRMRHPTMNTKTRFIGWIVVVVVIFILADAHEKIWWIVQRLFFYAKTTTPLLTNATESIRLPEIAQSVREAQALQWTALGSRMGGNWLVFVLGLLGLGFTTWRRPVLLLFFPYLALGIASIKLGNRFSMYGTVVIGMGMGLGISEVFVLLKQSQGRRWIAQLILACVALWPSAQLMQQVTPVPVLPQTYAQTFLDLRENSEPGALLWQWWDYGYAGQYYAERATMGDGGRHTGPWLYPLAKVHCAQSSRDAAQLMRYFSQTSKGDPVSTLRKMNASDAKFFLAELGRGQIDMPTTVPNYFVVSWENLRLGGWIGYYGHWDIVGGASSAGKIQQMHGQINLDSAAGAMAVGDKTVPVDSLDVVEEGGTRHFDWPNGTGMHVLINQFSRQVFLMDSAMYNSMMVQMLIAPPQNFAEEFTLVVDKYPWARAYKVR